MFAEYAPANPRSLDMMSTAARRGFSGSEVRMCSMPCCDATADTARVMAFTSGIEAATRWRALPIRDVAISSIALKIFFIDEVELILLRMTRISAADMLFLSVTYSWCRVPRHLRLWSISVSDGRSDLAQQRPRRRHRILHDRAVPVSQRPVPRKIS